MSNNKHLFSKLSISLVFVFSLFLTACEGFFTNNDLDAKIRAAVDYANMPFSTFTISAEDGTGTIIPSGPKNYKPTDYQNIEFTMKPSYEFIKWDFKYKITSQSSEGPELTATNPEWWKEYVRITKQEVSEANYKGEVTYTLQIQFIKAVDNLLIEPVCSLKPEIKTFLPVYKLSGESRENEISVEFNSRMDPSSFIFSQEELDKIPGITKTLKNVYDEIYGYEKDGQTIFKNIEITFASDESNINACYENIFYKVENKTLFIKPNKTNSVDFPGTVAEIRFRFKNGIKNESGAYMNETIKAVCLNKETSRKGSIAVILDKNAPVTYSDYSVGIRNNVTFTESSSVQFLRWKKTADTPETIDKFVVIPDDENPRKITFYAADEISQSEQAQIHAVYAQRPSIESFEVNDTVITSANTAVPKDSTIAIVFSEEIVLDSFIEKFSISCGANPVTDYFKTPVWLNGDSSTKTVIIQSDTALDTNDGNLKVTVLIPSTVYYNDQQDNITTPVTIGQDIAKTYTIISETNAKAKLKFNLVEAEGSLSPSTTITGEWSLGKTVPVTFVPDSAYEFLYWKSNDTSIVSFDDKTQKSTNMKIKKATSQGTTLDIYAVCVQKLQEPTLKIKIDDSENLITPLENNTYPKDSDIYLEFTQNVLLDNEKTTVEIFNGDVNVTKKYKITTNAKTLKIQSIANDRLSVEGQSNLNIKLYKGIYYSYSYTDQGQNKTKNIYLQGEYTKSFKIDETTRAKASIQITMDGEYGTIKYKGGTNNGQDATGDIDFSKDQSFTLEFTPTNDYEFLEWSINGTAVSNIQYSKLQLKEKTLDIEVKNAADGTVIIKPVCLQKLKVESIQIKYGDEPITPQNDRIYPKDSDIYIKFNMPPANLTVAKDQIDIICNSDSVKGKFTAAFDEDDETLLIYKASTSRIEATNETMVYITIKKDIYYLQDPTNQNSYQVKLDKRYESSYKIDKRTRESTQVTVDFNTEYGTIYNSDGTEFVTGTKSFYMDEELNLKIKTNDEYQFVYWNVTGPNVACLQNVNVASLQSEETNIKIINSNAGTVIIEPVCTEKLRIDSVKMVHPVFVGENATGEWLIIDGDDEEEDDGEEEYYPVKQYPKDTAVRLYFNKTISTPNLENYIKLYFKKLKDEDSIVSSSDDSNYFTLEHKIIDDKSVVTFKPVAEKFLKVKTTDIMYISVDKNIANQEISYTYAYSLNGVNLTKPIKMSKTFNEYYQINYESYIKFQINLSTGGSGLPSGLSNLIKITPDRGKNGLYNFGEEISVEYDTTSQNAYLPDNIFGNEITEHTNEYTYRAWKLKKYHTYGSLKAKITKTSGNQMTFEVYKAISGNIWTSSVQSMTVSINLKKTPQFDSISPITTNEKQTFTCDTPIVIKFTKPVDADTVHYGSIQESIYNNIWVCIPDVYGGYVEDGFEDISNYYSLDVIQDNTIIIKPKITLLDLFKQKKHEELQIYFMFSNELNPIKDTDGNSLIYNIPVPLKNKLEWYDFCDFFYCDEDHGTQRRYEMLGNAYDDWRVAPMTISSNVSNPRLRTDLELTLLGTSSSGDPKPNTVINDMTSLQANKASITSMGGLYTIYLNNDVIGNWSIQDFIFKGFVEIAITKTGYYNKSTQTINNVSTTILPQSTIIRQNYSREYSDTTNQQIIGGLTFNSLGYTTSNTEAPILRLDFTVSCDVYQVPYTVTYYVVYGTY